MFYHGNGSDVFAKVEKEARKNRLKNKLDFLLGVFRKKEFFYFEEYFFLLFFNIIFF